MTGTERDLEKPFERLLEVQLARELTQSAPELEIRNTARGGLTGGRWTKPDIVVASVNRYLSLAVPLLSLYGFELKTQTGFELSSIYQAAAQTRFLHFAYVVVPHPEDQLWRSRLAQIRGHAEELGIGLIRLDDPSSAAGYEVVITGRRHHPHPQSVDHFIEERMPDLVDWVRDRLRV
jgi:hypothetical protein